MYAVAFDSALKYLPSDICIIEQALSVEKKLLLNPKKKKNKLITILLASLPLHDIMSTIK